MNNSEQSAPNLADIQAKYTYRNPLLRYANQRFLETIDSMLAKLEFDTLLDAGCGEGIVLNAILQRFECRVVGMDYDPSRIESARKRQGKALLLTGDAHSLPFKDNSFDIISVQSVLHEIHEKQDLKKALHELKRVIKKDGLLIIGEWHSLTPHLVFSMGILSLMMSTIVFKTKYYCRNRIQ